MMCKCGCKLDVQPEFKELIIKARKIAGVPFVINSGARCASHNASCGSKSTSSHLAGLAVDIKATGSRERSLIMSALQQVGLNRFGLDSGFIHTDNDPHKDKDVIWLYS